MQVPHQHHLPVEVIPELKDSHNFCRNPGGLNNRPWCFTTNPNIRWEYCAVPQCGQTGMEPGREPGATPPSTPLPTSLDWNPQKFFYPPLPTSRHLPFLFLSALKSEPPSPQQTPYVLPPTVVSPAFSMSVIVIVLGVLAGLAFVTVLVLACRRRRRQWRNRKR